MLSSRLWFAVALLVACCASLVAASCDLAAEEICEDTWDSSARTCTDRSTMLDCLQAAGCQARENWVEMQRECQLWCTAGTFCHMSTSCETVFNCVTGDDACTACGSCVDSLAAECYEEFSEKFSEATSVECSDLLELEECLTEVGCSVSNYMTAAQKLVTSKGCPSCNKLQAELCGDNYGQCLKTTSFCTCAAAWADCLDSHDCLVPDLCALVHDQCSSYTCKTSVSSLASCTCAGAVAACAGAAVAGLF
eukprot:TRINITY_DN17139_c0_g1_i1.p1 TRINITY_DN17139_c0_g1~~TRINITY_DN17139_c0_g1_i1.p1  ORF type:complete len:251 (+),score=68.27 TRINITY_DN17139_c0_g1_i1:131-883(+)